MAIRISNITATFANSSHRYDGIGFSVNATAYAANSTLLHFKVNGNTVFQVTLDGGIWANGSVGSNGQVLQSDGTKIFWGNGGGPGGNSGVTSVASGNGLTGRTNYFNWYFVCFGKYWSDCKFYWTFSRYNTSGWSNCQ